MSPETQVIKVPRRLDSQIARFKLKTDSPGEGDVLLTIFDEFRLIGSLKVRVRADGAPADLVLKKIDEKIYRDPSGEDRRPLWGNAIQVSFSGRGRERVKFEVLLPDETDGVLTPKLHPLGESSANFNAGYIQNALNQFRDRVNRIEAMLGGGSTPGVPALDVVQEGMRMELEGAGRHIASELLSSDVRAYLDTGSHKIVHWILKDPELDAVPWELACNPYSGEFLSKNSVLVRVPVHEGYGEGVGGRKRQRRRPDACRPGRHGSRYGQGEPGLRAGGERDCRPSDDARIAQSIDPRRRRGSRPVRREGEF